MPLLKLVVFSIKPNMDWKILLCQSFNWRRPISLEARILNADFRGRPPQLENWHSTIILPAILVLCQIVKLSKHDNKDIMKTLLYQSFCPRVNKGQQKNNLVPFLLCNILFIVFFVLAPGNFNRGLIMLGLSFYFRLKI